MSSEKKLEQWSKEAPKWVVSFMPLLSLIVGGLFLWVTWFFYADAWQSDILPWFRWIQPALMILAGLMSLIAATLFAIRKRSGWELLWTALSIIPIILALRLLIVIVIFLAFVGRNIGEKTSQILGGTFLDQFSMSPRNIIVQAVIIIVVVLLFLWNKADKSKKIAEENKDE